LSSSVSAKLWKNPQQETEHDSNIEIGIDNKWSRRMHFIARYQPFVTVLSQTAHRWRSAFLKTLSLFRQSGTQDPAILQEIHPAPLSCRNNPVAGIMTVITLAE
jgi:hypothetical protein